MPCPGMVRRRLLRAPSLPVLHAIETITANCKVTEYMDIFARVDNLLDKRVEDPTGFLRPGLAACAGIRAMSW